MKHSINLKTTSRSWVSSIPDDVKGDRQGRLQFKFYPEGKSKSGEHLGAEGWFHATPEGGQQDWHFKFTLPKDRKHPPLQFQEPL